MKSGVYILTRQMRLVIDKVGGTINDILYLKSYGFGQVIFVVWIKFFSFEKHFSSVIVMWL